MKPTIQNTEKLFDNILTRCREDWKNGNRKDVIEQITGSDTLAAAYFAAALMPFLLGEDQAIFRKMLYDRAITAYGPCHVPPKGDDLASV